MNRRQRRILRTVLPGLGLVLFVLWFTLASPFREGPAGYRPGEENADVTRSLDITSSNTQPAVHFVDRAVESGLDFVHFRNGVRTSRLPEDMGGGVAWGDYDNDGDDDLFLVDLASTEGDERWGNRLYQNQGDGSFQDVSAHAGIARSILGMGVTWADLDSDGYLDLVVTGYNSLHLFHNQGNGTFREVSRDAGLTQSGFFSGTAVADYDLDGDLDIYVCRYVDYDDDLAEQVRDATLQYRMAVPVALNPSSFSDSPNLLYRNEGNLRFVDVAPAARVDGRIAGRLMGKSLGAIWSDWNEDGWPDLYVANDVSNNHLFLNHRDGTFEEMGAIAWVADPRGSMGLAIGDFDNDNDIDIFVSHWIAQENALYVNQAREVHGPNPGAAPLQAGDVTFADRADALGLGQSALDFVGWGTNFFDFDNDGHLDLFVANGSTFESEDDRTQLVPMRSILYRNLGSAPTTGSETRSERRSVHRGFSDCSDFAGPFFTDTHVARGFSPCDYDSDGDLDLLVSLFGEPVRLLRNENTTGHHWLNVRLRSPGPNRFAIGAMLRIQTPDFVRLHSNGSEVSYLSGSVTDAHIGLGDYAGEVVATVSWPGGTTQSFTISRTDRTVLLIEGSLEALPIETSQTVASRDSVLRSSSAPRENRPLGATGSRLKGKTYLAFQKSFREATRLRIAGQTSEAESLYRAALLLDPEHIDCHYYLGSVLFDQHRFPEAMESWERLLTISPRSTKAHFMLGVIQACPLEGARTNFAAARVRFLKVFELNKEDSGVVLRLGEIALVLDDLSEARTYLEAAVGSNFSSADGHYLLSYSLWKDGLRDRAVREMELAIEYAARDGVPARAASGALTEGDIADPAMLRLADTYRVRPLVDRLIGLTARAEGRDPARFCQEEADALDRRLAQLQSRR